MIVSMIVFAAAAAVAQPVPSFAGSLCFQGTSAPCVATKTANVDVSGADLDRDWVWTRSDGLRVVLGTLPRGAAEINLETKTRSVAFTVSGDGRRAWPADTEILVGDGKPRWKFSVPASRIARFRGIEVPEGKWEATFAAAHHFKATRPVAAERNVALGPIELRPLPVISGRVVRSEEGRVTGIEGAQLMTNLGKLQTVTDAAGRFRSELDVPTPKELVVIAPGMATVSIPLRDLPAEVDLGEIRLDRGVKLHVTLTRPPDDSVGALELELLQIRDAEHELSKVGKQSLGAKDTRATFSDIAAGKYLLLATGAGAFERVAFPVTVGSEGGHEALEIEPYRLTGRVKFGEDPMPNVTLNVRNRAWRGALAADANGRFEQTLWQHGKLSALITGEQAGSGIFVVSPELGSDPSEWNIDLPRRAIEGRVLDADTKGPLASARVDVQALRNGGGAAFFPAPVRSDGSFTVVAANEGKYDLRISHPERVGVTRSFEFNDDPAVHRVEILLERGVETTLEFVTPSGSPVAGAEAVEGIGTEPHNPARVYGTDREGKLTLRSAPGEMRTIYLVGGAFAIARFTAPKWPSDAAPLRVVVPPAVGSITVDVVDAEGRIASNDLRVRFNGELLPYAVSSRIAAFPAGIEARQFPRLPAGVYEFWAIRDARELLSPPASDPTRIVLTGGHQVARIAVP